VCLDLVASSCGISIEGGKKDWKLELVLLVKIILKLCVVFISHYFILKYRYNIYIYLKVIEKIEIIFQQVFKWVIDVFHARKRI